MAELQLWFRIQQNDRVPRCDYFNAAASGMASSKEIKGLFFEGAKNMAYKRKCQEEMQEVLDQLQLDATR